MAKTFTNKRTSRTIPAKATPVRSVPFKEYPGGRFEDNKRTGLSADELFNLFTADVIKQKVIFTR